MIDILHKLKLAIRDNFVDRALRLVKPLTKTFLKAHYHHTRRCFLECFFTKEMEVVALAILEKGLFSLLDGPIFGRSSLVLSMYPSFFIIAVATGKELIVQRMLQVIWRLLPLKL